MQLRQQVAVACCAINTGYPHIGFFLPAFKISAAKVATVNIIQALSEELYENNVRINVINPQRTATLMRFNAFGKEPADSLLSPEKV